MANSVSHSDRCGRLIATCEPARSTQMNSSRPRWAQLFVHNQFGSLSPTGDAASHGGGVCQRVMPAVSSANGHSSDDRRTSARPFCLRSACASMPTLRLGSCRSPRTDDCCAIRTTYIQWIPIDALLVVV